MKSFSSVVIAKHPTDRVWSTVRDHLPELGRMLDDIDRITVVDRVTLPDGRLRLVNEWRAKPRLPIPIETVTGSDAFVWLDHAEWDDREKGCKWRIEPQFFAGRIRCHGTTRYEPAIGGRGCKITFDGELDLAAGAGAGTSALIERSIAPIVESVVTIMIPKNFRKIVEAAGRLLEEHA